MAHSWLLRPSPSGNNRMNEFLAGGYIAIGWRGTDFSGKSREQLKEVLSRSPHNLASLALGNAYATVDIFVNKMQEGDLVLVANGDDIHFCIITSDYYFDPNFDDERTGYSHQRKVEWLTHIQRQELPMNLRMSLKVHRTTADLQEHYETIATLAYGNRISEVLSESEMTPMITVSYPLRPAFSLSVSIPRDITRNEAERLGDFIKTLYFN